MASDELTSVCHMLMDPESCHLEIFKIKLSAVTAKVSERSFLIQAGSPSQILLPSFLLNVDITVCEMF